MKRWTVVVFHGKKNLKTNEVCFLIFVKLLKLKEVKDSKNILNWWCDMFAVCKRLIIAYKTIANIFIRSTLFMLKILPGGNLPTSMR